MSLTPKEKSDVLMEALPHLRAFQGQRIVIKYGGHAMTETHLRESFARNVVFLKLVGVRPVIVHGGGPEISRTLKLMGVESSFVDGMRVTDAKTMEVVEMVLSGKINAEIVSLINQQGGRAVGLSGKDDRLIEAEKLLKTKAGAPGQPDQSVDLGLVGRVKRINTALLDALEDFIPVISPVGVGRDGESYNINADPVAGHIAAAIKAQKLVMLTDVPGVMDENGQLASSLPARKAWEMMEKGIISGGMIPKVNCCLQALDDGVPKAHIVDGRLPHALLLEVFTDQGIGTEIVGEG